MVPGGSVFQKGRVEGPERTPLGLDRMNEALLVLIEKGAEAARSASDVEPAMPLFAVESDEGLDRQAEEIGNPLDLLGLKKNAAFSITALPALLALKSLHKIFLSLFERFYRTPLRGCSKPRGARGIV
jgi:hypothetical protein